jgi:phage-related protein
MSQQITYNSISLQDSNVVTKNLSHEDVDNRKANFQRLGRSGAKLVDDKFDIKIIKLEGVIKDTTKALLDARIDSLKKSIIGVTEKNLDILYSTGTRRYVSTCTNFIIKREFYNINYVEFEMEFTVGYPFGKNIDTTTLHDSAMTTGTIDSFYLYGSARPLPKIKLTVNSATSLTGMEIQNLTSGDTITIAHTLHASDIIIIDCDLLKVTVNGVEIDYTGIFPEFETGWNDLYVWFTGSTYNVDLKIIYYQLWV